MLGVRALIERSEVEAGSFLRNNPQFCTACSGHFAPCVWHCHRAVAYLPRSQCCSCACMSVWLLLKHRCEAGLTRPLPVGLRPPVINQSRVVSRAGPGRGQNVSVQQAGRGCTEPGGDATAQERQQVAIYGVHPALQHHPGAYSAMVPGLGTPQDPGGRGLQQKGELMLVPATRPEKPPHCSSKTQQQPQILVGSCPEPARRWTGPPTVNGETNGDNEVQERSSHGEETRSQEPKGLHDVSWSNSRGLLSALRQRWPTHSCPSTLPGGTRRVTTSQGGKPSSAASAYTILLAKERHMSSVIAGVAAMSIA